MNNDAMLLARSRDASRLAARSDVARLSAEISVELHAMGEALAARLDRGARRMVLALSTLLVASSAAVVLAAWSAS